MPGGLFYYKNFLQLISLPPSNIRNQNYLYHPFFLPFIHRNITCTHPLTKRYFQDSVGSILWNILYLLAPR